MPLVTPSAVRILRRERDQSNRKTNAFAVKVGRKGCFITLGCCNKFFLNSKFDLQMKLLSNFFDLNQIDIGRIAVFRLKFVD